MAETQRLQYEADRAVARAKRRGELVSQPCEVCGNPRSVAHHRWGYAEPLRVAWLCQSHHATEHARMREEATQRRRDARLIGDLAGAWVVAEAALPESPDPATSWKLRLIWHPLADEPEKYAYEARYERHLYEWDDKPTTYVGRGGTPTAALLALVEAAR